MVEVYYFSTIWKWVCNLQSCHGTYPNFKKYLNQMWAYNGKPCLNLHYWNNFAKVWDKIIMNYKFDNYNESLIKTKTQIKTTVWNVLGLEYLNKGNHILK